MLVSDLFSGAAPLSSWCPEQSWSASASGLSTSMYIPGPLALLSRSIRAQFFAFAAVLHAAGGSRKVYSRHKAIGRMFNLQELSNQDTCSVNHTYTPAIAMPGLCMLDRMSICYRLGKNLCLLWRRLTSWFCWGRAGVVLMPKHWNLQMLLPGQLRVWPAAACNVCPTRHP